jgi:hypothetical protein
MVHANIVNTKESLDGIVHLHGCLNNDKNNIKPQQFQTTI